MTLGFRYHILWTHFQVKRYIADIEMHDSSADPAGVKRQRKPSRRPAHGYMEFIFTFPKNGVQFYCYSSRIQRNQN